MVTLQRGDLFTFGYCSFQEFFISMEMTPIPVIIMLSVIFSLYIHYTTILAYCMDIRVISLFHVYTVPRRGIEPAASWLQVRSATD